MVIELNGYDSADAFVAEWLDDDQREDTSAIRALLPDDAILLFAYYTCEDYSGTAFGLFEQHGKLYEVNGSHCSCYGLEGQWEPEEANVAELRKRATEGCMWHGNDGGYDSDRRTNPYTIKLLAVLDDYERRHRPALAA